MGFVRRLTVALLLAAAFWRLADAEDNRVRAVFVDRPPRIDGWLDDPAWQKAAVVDRFFQRDPKLGEPVSEKTEFLICYDRANIYFAFRCYEPDPSLITAKEMARDVSLGEDDRVQVILDTYLDRRNGYWFQIGPRGSIGDALVADDGADFNKNWDGLWEGKARIHSKGWDAEIAIPFATLSFRPGDSRWGMKLIRHIRRKLESSYWPVANRNTYTFQISDEGILEGLEGISQGVGLDVNPYLLGGLDHKTVAADKLVGDVGGDVFYRLTPGLRTAVTVNTDFAQTEVDSVQINLTRFPLYYPEKRDFFLDGASYFTFGPTSEQFIPFFSRRIGLDIDGLPVDILGGGKLTGQEGRWNIGALDVVDSNEGVEHNYAVARIRRNIGKQSSVGFIATSGNAISTADNSVAGFDLKLGSSTFHQNKNIALWLYGLKSWTDGLHGNDTALGAEFSYPNDFLNVRAGVRQIGEDFVAGVGFVPRTGVRDSYLNTTVGPRPEKWGILQAQFRFGFDIVTDLDNRLLTRLFTLSPFFLRFVTGDEVSFTVAPQREVLDETFQIHPFHKIDPGTYDFVRYEAKFQSALRRNLWFGTAQRWGSFYDGTRHDLLGSFGYKVAVPLYIGAELERDHVTLPDGAFTVGVSRVNLNLLFSPNITLYNFVQYNDLAQAIGWQSRFRWILKPGRELLFVWNSRTLDPFDRLALTEASARFKIRWNYRF